MIIFAFYLLWIWYSVKLTQLLYFYVSLFGIW